MTPLAEILVRRIRASGPMSLADYMAESLIHPEHGYYTGRDPLGAAGDFTTAPEISQMFGELVGLWLAQCWLDRGSPAPFVLAEAGPGRGTLMADILRVTAVVPGFHAAMRLVLVEVSPPLRARQARSLAGHDPQWVEGIADLPGGPLFLVANEFIDALPIRQFQRDAAGWRERVVGLDGAGGLCLGLTPPAAIAALQARLADTAPGDIVETRPAAEAIAAILGARLAETGGVALFIDYGDWQSLGDTFQALRGHRSCPPLEAPGQADLTAHVDFAALAHAAAPATTTPMTTQGAFLRRLGIDQRSAILARGLDGPAADRHRAAHRRLTHAEEMGTLFKVMAMYSPHSPMPPGWAQ